MSNPNDLLPRPVVTAIAIATTTMWVIAILADIFIKGYEVNQNIHIAFMTIVGALFGRYVITVYRKSNGNGNQR